MPELKELASLVRERQALTQTVPRVCSVMSRVCLWRPSPTGRILKDTPWNITDQTLKWSFGLGKEYRKAIWDQCSEICKTRDNGLSGMFQERKIVQVQLEKRWVGRKLEHAGGRTVHGTSRLPSCLCDQTCALLHLWQDHWQQVGGLPKASADRGQQGGHPGHAGPEALLQPLLAAGHGDLAKKLLDCAPLEEWPCWRQPAHRADHSQSVLPRVHSTEIVELRATWSSQPLGHVSYCGRNQQ